MFGRLKMLLYLATKLRDMERIDLTKYSEKSVRQLLNNNIQVRQKLVHLDIIDVVNYIESKFILNEKQIKYFVDNA